MVTRRHVLKTLALAAAAPGYWARLSAAETEDPPRGFRWRVPPAHVGTVQRDLVFEGEVSPTKDEKGVVLAFVFIGSALLPYLAKAILSLHRETIHGGIVIDTRGEEIRIDTKKSLPSRVLFVITPQGEQLFERDEIGDPAQLVRLLKGGGAGCAPHR